MNASADDLADVLAAPAASGKPVDMSQLFGRLSMDVTGINMLGCVLDRSNRLMPAGVQQATDLISICKMLQMA